MNITSFDDLLTTARQQAQPQRLLFVFARAELPEDASESQRQNFLRGEGGALVPQMCVDKTPDELKNFGELVNEAQQMGQVWSIVFVAALSGLAGAAPDSDVVDKALQGMVESIKAGQLGNFIPFGQDGLPVMLG